MTSGTRPNPLQPLLQNRSIRFAAGLTIVVAIPMAVLFYFQFRSLSDLESTSAVVLHQLSSQTADSIAKSIEETLKRPHISVLLRVPQARQEPLDLPWIDPVLEQALADNPFIDAFYVWTELASSGEANRWYVFDRASLTQPAGEVKRRFRDDPTLGAAMLPRMQEIAKLRRAIVAFSDHQGGATRYIQAQLRFSTPSRDHMSSLIAFAVDADRLRTTHLPALIRARLGGVRQPTGFPSLEAQLVDDRSQLLFDSGRQATATVVDERSFPLIFFDKELLEFAAPYEEHRELWRLRTNYGAKTIPEVVAANTRPQMLLMLVLAVGMSLGVFLVARAAAREVRLAELKSDFVASVSHDLKTPLALIQLFAETLELGRVRTADRAQEYYGIINSEAKKLTRLIENILDFSRMEAGLRPYHMEPADAGGLVTHVLDRMAYQLSRQQLTLTTSIEPGLPPILADTGAVEQAIENLLANAIKYSGESRDIAVSVRRDGRYVQVGVADRGIGISRREQGRIFRKFYRVQQGLGGGPQGCGLGLAIVDHAMRGHGGFVRVASELGHGSTFTLNFPVPATAAPTGAMDEAHPRDRGRTADAARPA